MLHAIFHREIQFIFWYFSNINFYAISQAAILNHSYIPCVRHEKEPFEMQKSTRTLKIVVDTHRPNWINFFLSHRYTFENVCFARTLTVKMAIKLKEENDKMRNFMSICHAMEMEWMCELHITHRERERKIDGNTFIIRWRDIFVAHFISFSIPIRWLWWWWCREWWY